ncbi:MAG: phosphohistidine phosphatase SixA [Alteromonadaceae bacterium]|uniref:phosphohistidine phosphatase SixA n=1 Tax=Marinobacter sp. V034 TaxID=3459610 RepID=UPI000C3EEA48|nr:phosphohistidine phosphatase SixA [Alteromonadaceae bacterium]MBH85784.1 phosphohistidine phosphatase SixA [Alteromonadaceae bacterium]
MKLIVMRHGEAGWHTLDQERELTEAGRMASAKVARDIAESKWSPSVIWCSPLVRAQQTAGIVSEVLNIRAVDTQSFITPDDDPGLCLDALLQLSDPAQTLMIVSHMPLVGALSTLLVDGHRRGIPFMTSQAVVIDLPIVGPGCGDLKSQFIA